jgi:hypothetical protein
MDDERLLDQALQRLRQTGTLEYTGEFGAEITTFIPFACWLKHEGLLAGRRILSYRGMRPYYCFLDEGEFAEKPGPRHWLTPEQRDWPGNSTYTATRRPWHRMPDYRARYRGQGRTFERPVLFIQNKFTVERWQGPLNYLPLNLLAQLCRCSERFDVVYSRPRPLRGDNDYTVDENVECDYPDLAIVRKAPGVLVLEDWCESAGLPYNQTKLEILAKAHLFVAVQGGGAHLLACFGNSLLLLLHREGREYPHAYRSGPYKYLADPPPLLLLARSFEQLERGVDLVGATRIEQGEILVDAGFAPVLDELRH